MKKAVFSLLAVAALAIATSANATVRTVSNDPNSPGQYTDIQVAINAASAGDTILVSGSTTPYTPADGSYITIAKKLILLGTGYNPYKDFSRIVSTLGQTIDLQTGCDGTVIQGFVINALINYWSIPLTNITIKRNQLNQYINITGNGWLVSENWIANGATISINGSNMIIQNNLFSYSANVSNQPANTNTLFVNNTLVGVGGANFYINLNNALIANNIFYHNNGDPNAAYSLGSGNSVANNVVYGNTNANPFNMGAGLPNQGSGNKLGVDPKFTSLVFDESGYPSVNSNFLLQSSSTVKTGGTDGKEMGIYGGSTPAQNPLRGTPAIPQVSSMLLNNVTVAPGGTLSVTLKARAGN